MKAMKATKILIPQRKQTEGSDTMWRIIVSICIELCTPRHLIIQEKEANEE